MGKAKIHKKIPNEFRRRGFDYKLAERFKLFKTEFAMYRMYDKDEYMGVELHIIQKVKEDRVINGEVVNRKHDEYLPSDSAFGVQAWFFRFTGRNIPELDAKEFIQKKLEETKNEKNKR